MADSLADLITQRFGTPTKTGASRFAGGELARSLGVTPDYGWSEDKARQYATTQRAEFTAFLNRQGFGLE